MITAETHTDGGAVIRKLGSAWLEGTPAISIIFIFHFMILVLKFSFAYADIQTSNEYNKTHMDRTKHT